VRSYRWYSFLTRIPSLKRVGFIVDPASLEPTLHSLIWSEGTRELLPLHCEHWCSRPALNAVLHSYPRVFNSVSFSEFTLWISADFEPCFTPYRVIRHCSIFLLISENRHMNKRMRKNTVHVWIIVRKWHWFTQFLRKPVKIPSHM
jgi:hypothetical protein